MQIDLCTLTAQQFIRSLTGLKGTLQKAAAYAEVKKVDMAVMFGLRLAPDQFPLAKQIQITCDTAKFCVSRLTGLEPPAFEDNETTVEQFLARIDNTIAFLKTAKPENFDGYQNREIRFYWNPGFHVKGDAYLQQYALPNFYFHLTTAYSILRANGVDLGKADFIAEMQWQKDAN